MAAIRTLVVLCLCAATAAFTFGCSDDGGGGQAGSGGSGTAGSGGSGTAGSGGSGAAGAGGTAGGGGTAGAGGTAGSGGGPACSDAIDFEDACGPYTWDNFGGGVATVVENPDSSGINTTAKVAEMQKFAGEVFGGSTLFLADLGGPVDWARGTAFTMKVLATREVPVLFKLEGLAQERSDTYTGSGTWEELCYDFTGNTGGADATAITFIFDLGVNGDAAGDPDNWTFFFDGIVQTDSCGGVVPTLGPVDFEPGGLGAGFTWAVFENGDNPPLEFIANPDATGANTSATVAKFTARQAGQPFAGTNTSDLPTFTLGASNSCVKIKVWKSVVSDVGLKFEMGAASTGEIKVANTATDEWEELTFDFSGKIGEPSSTDITGFVVFPDFAARTQENVIYFDDIVFLDSGQCP
jgi:hypothetical protein